MNHFSRFLSSTASLWLAVFFFCGCSDSLLQPLASAPKTGNDRLSIKGQVCTQPPDINGFPVKVLFILDQSGSMCVSDPPSSQAGSSFCDFFNTQAIQSGITIPARIRAVESLLNQFVSEPNVQVSVLPFETNVKPTWPPNASSGGPWYQSPGAGSVDPTLINYLSGLQSQLGKGTDYQGALSQAYATIASDIAATEQANPSLLPRSRYVIVFLTDGTPYPRCDANNGTLPPSSYATPDQPWLIWPDSFGTGDFCQVTTPVNQGGVFGYIPGTDRNQNYQLFSLVDRIMSLKQQYNVGDIRLHTVLLLNKAAVQLCGTACYDLYGSFPGYPAAQYTDLAEKVATWLLTQMSTRGNGVFQEFVSGDIQSLGLGALNYASFASPNVMKTMLLQNLRAVPKPSGRVPDSDGDGASDDVDNSYTIGTSPYVQDTDQDCFDDNFEYLRADQGFNPIVRDSRGCDPSSPVTLNCTCDDVDGDGLSQFAEAFLGTDHRLVDSDGDGIPDGIEARYRLDPLNPNIATLDTDGDGITDQAEILAGTDPTTPDRALYDREAYQYEATGTTQSDQSVCYDFNVSNIGLIATPGHAGVLPGFNLFKLWFAESPQSGVATDYGDWKTACAWAQYNPPNQRVPLGPDLTLQDSNFLPPNQLANDVDYLTQCAGTPP